MRTPAYVLCAALLGLLLLASTASAHRAMIFAYTEGNEVITESSFSSGRPCQNSQVQVKNAATGVLLLEGKTDTKGIFRFPLPKEAQKAAKGLQIILDAGEGHRGEWLLEPEEYLNAPAATSKTDTIPATATPDSRATASTVAPPSPAPGAVDAAALEKIVATAVDKKIAPLKRILLESQEKIRMSDILGGIGYIVGLAGLLAFLRSRSAAK